MPETTANGSDSAATLDPVNVSVKFDIPWKISVVQFDGIPATKITKNFITTREYVAFNWRMEFSAKTEEGRRVFCLCYANGPLASFNASYNLLAKKPDDTYSSLFSSENQKFDRGVIYEIAGVKNNKTSGSLFGCITIKMHMSNFQQSVNDLKNDGMIFSSDIDNRRRIWFRELYEQIFITNESSDVTLISADDREFYCHRLILTTQSDAFKAMFRNASTEEEKKGLFRFPTFNSEVLHAALEFFYSFDVDFAATRISISDTIVLTDFAEQYGLERLKRKCTFQLWKQILDQPTECLNVIRYADLHDDMKHLKDRCFEVLVENYEELSLQSVDIFNCSRKRKHDAEDGNDQDNRLQAEFNLYMKRRVEGTFE